MEPISFKSSTHNASEQSEQRETAAQQVLKIRDLFVEISLKADPKTSALLLCRCSAELFSFHEAAFNEINELFNDCTGSKILNGVSQEKISPSEHLKQHQHHFDSTLDAVKQRMASRNMAMDLEVSRLCWSDLPLLNKWIIASDTLQVWEKLAQAIDVEGPSAENLTTINSCIIEADKFSEWFGKNIGQLRGLQTLDLSRNRLTALPVEIGQLRGLQRLDLSRNQLTALPAEIGQLRGLQALYLYDNRLTALPAEIGQLRGLQTLSLHNNRLTALPVEIGQLRGLQRLDLSGNQLAALPVEIGLLAGLCGLDLSNNQLAALPVEIGQLAELSCLGLRGNQFVAFPVEICQLTELRILDLAANELTALPGEIGQLAGLHELDLSYNQLAALPVEIGNLTRLLVLDLSNNLLAALPVEIDQLAENGCNVRR